MISRVAFAALIAAGFGVAAVTAAPVVAQAQTKETPPKPGSKTKPKPKTHGRQDRGTPCGSPGRPPCPTL